MRDRGATKRRQGLALELFGGLAGNYERSLDYATVFQDRRWKKWVVDRVGATAGESVLDVGCGTLVLEERDLAGCMVVGIDLTKEMLRVGSSKRLPIVLGLVNGDAEHLPFQDGEFDAVVSCYVAKYVALEGFVKELARVTKTGGRVVVYDFVRPRRWSGIVVRAYLRGVIGPLGALLRAAGRLSAWTFERLPDIVEEAIWDVDFPNQAAAASLKIVKGARMSGVVAAYHAVKLEQP